MYNLCIVLILESRDNSKMKCVFHFNLPRVYLYSFTIQTFVYHHPTPVLSHSYQQKLVVFNNIYHSHIYSHTILSNTHSFMILLSPKLLKLYTIGHKNRHGTKYETLTPIRTSSIEPLQQVQNSVAKLIPSSCKAEHAKLYVNNCTGVPWNRESNSKHPVMRLSLALPLST